LPVTTNKYISYIQEYAIGMLMTFLLSLKVWRCQGFDVIHATNPPDLFFIVGWFYRLFGKKFVFDQRDLSPEMYLVKFKGRLKILHRILLFLEWCLYQSSEIVITSNLSQKRFAVERGHYPLGRVFIVGNGPDLDRLKLVEPEYELKKGRRYLLAYIGEMEVQDGVEYAIKQAIRTSSNASGRLRIVVHIVWESLPTFSTLPMTSISFSIWAAVA
jgi:glycosyltransferase involved in cell wall biosynthesis